MNKMKLKKRIVIFLSLLLAVITLANLGLSINVKADEQYQYKGYETYVYINGDECEIAKYNLEDGSVSNTVGPDEVYSWGRTSALLVYASVMQLYEQEKIDLDTSIMEYMPDYFKSNVKFTSDFTVRQLMNHQAGFQDVYYYKYTNNPADLITLESVVVDCVPDQVYMPGTTVAYSDYGVCLLAYMVENVADMNFDTYAKTFIFEKLGMTNTSARANHEDNQYILDLYRQSSYYSYQSEYALPYYSSMYPALSVIGTIQDMAVFGNALINGMLFEKESTTEEFFTPDVFYLDGESPRLASGMAVFKYGDNNEIYGTVGTGIVSRAGMLLNAKDKSVICMASNQYAVSKYWNEYVTSKYGEMSQASLNYPTDISGRYVQSITVNSGKLSFLGLFDTFTVDFKSGVPITYLDNNDLYFVDGTQGKTYKENGSDTAMQFAYFDIMPYSQGMFIFKITLLVLMGLAYLYAMVSLPVGAFIFLKGKFSDGPKAPLFRKYYYIESAVIFFYFMFFLSMCSSAMSSGSPTYTMVVSFTYYMGILISFVYLVFLFRTGRKEECSVFEKGNYYINAYNAIVLIIFTIIYKLFLF